MHPSGRIQDARSPPGPNQGVPGCLGPHPLGVPAGYSVAVSLFVVSHEYDCLLHFPNARDEGSTRRISFCCMTWQLVFLVWWQL